MVLVKPATVVQWHRQGFRLFWRWRSRSGRPSMGHEVRDLIRQMNAANPLWGAPRIHGELLKLGIKISQATVAKYMIRRRKRPSPTWRSFLLNQAKKNIASRGPLPASLAMELLNASRDMPLSLRDFCEQLRRSRIAREMIDFLAEWVETFQLVGKQIGPSDPSPAVRKAVGEPAYEAPSGRQRSKRRSSS
jgi:hypothetical protein